MFFALIVACADPPAAERAQAFFAGRPLSERPIADGFDAPPGLRLDAASCGTCHPAEYAEWRVSTHAHAWVDPQLQAELTKSENRWMCQNCHTPLLRQQAEWPVGLRGEDVEQPIWVDNPNFDPALQAEGISCTGCHLRDGVLVGPTGAPTDAHPTRADPAWTGAELCLRCHQAVQTYPGKSFVCTFQTGDEWQAGPFAAAGVPCQGCHMPAREGGGRRHWWAGGGIPKVAGVYPPPEALPPGLVVTAVSDGDFVVVEAVNANAGHRVPTGDPERFYRIGVSFRDANGLAVGAPWSLRIGQTWTWWPTPEKKGDNRVAPTESHTERIPIPAGAASAHWEVTRHRMTPEARDHHKLDGYPIEAPVSNGMIHFGRTVGAPAP